MIAAIANGSPTKKLRRQLTASVRTPPRSGPPIWLTAMMPPMRPMNLPRSRGEMMSVMSTVASAMRPPAPMPWNARSAMSVPTFCDRPASAEETTATTSATWMRTLRLVRSASLPQIGVEIVMASRVEVTTQV